MDPLSSAYRNRIRELEEENKRLKEAVEKASCGPRTDPSKCSSCNGTGVGSSRHPCICGGKGTVEAERDGYKVAELERMRSRAGLMEEGVMCDSDFIVIQQQEKELDALNTRIQQFDHSFREIVVALGMAGKFGGVDVDDHSVVEKVREVMQENARLKEGGK